MLVEITENPIEISEILNEIRVPSAGAVSSFLGTTRDTFNGKRVVRLEYECYTELAVKQLNKIAQEATNKFNLLNVAIVHRIGLVEIGEASIAVAVASVHRKESFEALDWIMDQVKGKVAIWKKEIYSDSSVWKENPEFEMMNQVLNKEC
jgi:molybdopterin synthase catalytic subunit